MALDIASIAATAPFSHGDSPVGLSAQVQAAVSMASPKPSATKTATPKAEPVIPSDLQQTLRDMQRLSEAFNTHLSFSVNQKLDSIIVKVVDSQTDKVVREIPPAELQHVYEAIRETIGLLFDRKA